jgi:predicted AlkP superfamily phosphohydrolase/phosphomutase
MELPRWTAWPALALIFALALTAVPRPVKSEPEPLSRSDAAAPKTTYPRLAVLGIDGLDPDLLAEAIERFPERTQHFARLARENGIHALGTSTPPQSPVAWSNFITGLNPGGHGVYDFLHRDPVTRAPIPGSVKSEPSHPIGLWSNWQFPRGGESESNRTGKAFWQLLADHGVPADIWRMPANFPVEPANGLSFSGMMTPALDSAYGECTLYTTDPPPTAGLGGARVIGVSEYGGRVDSYLTGPPNAFKEGDPSTRVPLTLHLDRENGAAAVEVGGNVLVLRPGEWSDFVQVSFSLLPMHLMDISGVVRFYLRSIEPQIELYASPVNIDPLEPVLPVSLPEDASAELADREHGGIGIYYTQGMPEDVNALKHRALDEAEFMAQSKLVHREGERMLDYALDKYLARPEGGLLFFYFSGVDLCSHMMWRLRDTSHPHHDAALAAQDSSRWSEREGSTWKDTVLDLYLQLDPVVGHLRQRLGEDTALIVLSDHGFAPYGREFNLNAWLWREGYLVLNEGVDPAQAPAHVYGASVDWTRTRAYGVGFNGLYLNLAGREQNDPKTEADESGIVQPGAEADELLAELKAKLEAIRDEERGGAQVIVRADLAREVYQGERAGEAPDLIVGYNANYGNSDDASLGRIDGPILRDNLGGTFNGSHLMVPDVVAGTLMANRPVADGAHRLEDVTVEILAQYGIAPVQGMQGKPVLRRGGQAQQPK